MDTFINFVESLQGQPWAPVVFILAYALACLALPISLFPVAGGVLFGIRGGLLCNMTAAMMGAAAAFFLARRVGRAPLERWLGERFRRAEECFSVPGFQTLLALRLLGLPPFGLLNYLAGLSRIGWGKYLAASFLGFLPWTFFLTYFSGSFWEVLSASGAAGFREALKQKGQPLFWALAGLGVLLGLTAFWKSRKRAGLTKAEA